MKQLNWLINTVIIPVILTFLPACINLMMGGSVHWYQVSINSFFVSGLRLTVNAAHKSLTTKGKQDPQTTMVYLSIISMVLILGSSFFGFYLTLITGTMISEGTIRIVFYISAIIWLTGIILSFVAEKKI